MNENDLKIFINDFDNFAETFLIDETGEKIRANILTQSKMLTFLKPFIPKEGMILTNVDTNDKYYLTGNAVKDYIDPIFGEYLGYKIKFLSKSQYESTKTSHSSFHIQNIHGSAIVGNQHVATINNGVTLEEIKTLITKKPNEDREILEKLINRVEIILEDNQPISKGTFAKFANILNKYTDIALPLGSLLIKWLAKSE